MPTDHPGHRPRLKNSTGDSLNNTVRNMLFLPCPYEDQFSDEQAIDSLWTRGDVR